MVDLKTPWSIAPLEGKYYGTRIIDCNMDLVMRVGHQETDRYPSVREFYTEDQISDNHYESQGALEVAREIVRRVNGE